MFCEGCGKSFNVTICPAKHESSASASHCATCGSSELSTPARGIKLSAPNRLLAVVIGLILLRVLTPLLPTFICWIVKGVGWLFSTVFAPILWLLVQLMLPFLILWGVIGVFLQVLSGEKINVYKVYLALSKRLLDALLVAAKLLGEFLIRFVVSGRKKE